MRGWKGREREKGSHVKSRHESTFWPHAHEARGKQYCKQSRQLTRGVGGAELNPEKGKGWDAWEFKRLLNFPLELDRGLWQILSLKPSRCKGLYTVLPSTTRLFLVRLPACENTRNPPACMFRAPRWVCCSVSRPDAGYSSRGRIPTLQLSVLRTWNNFKPISTKSHYTVKQKENKTWSPLKRPIISYILTYIVYILLLIIYCKKSKKDLDKQYLLDQK
jgi:hypothetical protein